MTTDYEKEPLRDFPDLPEEASSASEFTVIISAIGAIPAYETPTPKNRQDAMDAISQLCFADLWRLPPFQIRKGTVRLRVQGTYAGWSRIWTVQVTSASAVNRHCKISEIIIDGALSSTVPEDRQHEVLGKAQVALVASLNDSIRREVRTA